MTTYLRRYIPGRADHARRMKQAVVYNKDPADKSVEIRDNRQKKRMEKVRVKVGWKWGEEQEDSFQQVKRSIMERATTGGDVTKQYHLSCDASQTGLGAVLFQFSKAPPGTVLTSKLWNEVQVVMFISQRLSAAEEKYLNTEREALAVLRALEESRWLIVGSPYPTKVYTDHSALLTILNGKGSHQGRIASWMIRLSEYQVHQQKKFPS